jgi:hypothetical protein
MNAHFRERTTAHEGSKMLRDLSIGMHPKGTTPARRNFDVATQRRSVAGTCLRKGKRTGEVVNHGWFQPLARGRQGRFAPLRGGPKAGHPLTAAARAGCSKRAAGTGEWLRRGRTIELERWLTKGKNENRPLDYECPIQG